MIGVEGSEVSLLLLVCLLDGFWSVINPDGCFRCCWVGYSMGVS
jgi:hypothetical protein